MTESVFESAGYMDGPSPYTQGLLASVNGAGPSVVASP